VPRKQKSGEVFPRKRISLHEKVVLMGEQQVSALPRKIGERVPHRPPEKGRKREFLAHTESLRQETASANRRKSIVHLQRARSRPAKGHSKGNKEIGNGGGSLLWGRGIHLVDVREEQEDPKKIILRTLKRGKIREKAGPPEKTSEGSKKIHEGEEKRNPSREGHKGFRQRKVKEGSATSRKKRKRARKSIRPVIV